MRAVTYGMTFVQGPPLDPPLLLELPPLLVLLDPPLLVLLDPPLLLLEAQSHPLWTGPVQPVKLAVFPQMAWEPEVHQ